MADSCHGYPPDTPQHKHLLNTSSNTHHFLSSSSRTLKYLTIFSEEIGFYYFFIELVAYSYIDIFELLERRSVLHLIEYLLEVYLLLTNLTTVYSMV